MEDKKERKMEVDKESEEVVSKIWKREGEKGEDEMVVNRRCLNPFSCGAFEKFS